MQSVPVSPLAFLGPGNHSQLGASLNPSVLLEHQLHTATKASLRIKMATAWEKSVFVQILSLEWKYIKTSTIVNCAEGCNLVSFIHQVYCRMKCILYCWILHRVFFRLKSGYIYAFIYPLKPLQIRVWNHEMVQNSEFFGFYLHGKNIKKTLMLSVYVCLCQS